jgi:tetratricopeptide (TPR) repeat protein
MMSDWRTYFDLGSKQLNRKRLREACSSFKRALSALGADDPPLAEAKVLMQLGACKLLRKNFAEAETALTRALEIAEANAVDHDARRVLTDVSCHIAGLQALRGDSQRAQSNLHKIIERMTELGEHRLNLNPLKTLADLSLGDKDYATAERLYEQALEIQAPQGDSVDLAQLLFRLSEVCELQEKYIEADKFRNRASDVAKRKLVENGVALDLVQRLNKIESEVALSKGAIAMAQAVNAALAPVFKKTPTLPWS